MGDGQRLAHIAHGRRPATIDQHVTGGDGLQAHGLDGGRGRDMVPDQQFRIAPADQ